MRGERESGRRNAARTLAQAQWDRVLEASRKRRKRSQVEETRVKLLKLCYFEIQQEMISFQLVISSASGFIGFSYIRLGNGGVKVE